MRQLKSLLLIVIFPLSTYARDLSDVHEVIQTFAPLVKFSSGECYFPSSMPWYIERVALRGPNNQILVPLGQLQDKDLLTHNTEEHFLDPNGNRDTYKGEPIVDNQVNAPCYINYVHKLEEKEGKKSGRAILQAIFFFPYNEPTPLLQIGKILELLNIRSVGSHEGDIEHIDIFLRQDGDHIFIERVFFARHKRDGVYIKGNQLEIENGHPVVYSAQFGHASYDRAIPVVNALADSANGEGPYWECWKHYEVLNWQNPEVTCQEWLLFKGRVGTDKSKNPKSKATGKAVRGFQRGSKWYRIGDVKKVHLRSIKIKSSSGRVSENFKLSPDQKHHTLLWEVEGSDVPANISYSLMKDIPWWPDKHIKSFTGSSNETSPISDSDLYISSVRNGKSGAEYTLKVSGLI